MNKFIEIYCPKESYKNYFSKKNNGYTNSLNVYLNDKILFEKINDCEELLPIKLVSQQNINIKTKNELKFDYDIKFENIGEEKVLVIFTFENNDCNIKIERKNYVKHSEYLDSEYTVTFEVNDFIKKFGKEYHEGKTKKIEFKTTVSLQQPVNLRWWSKKSFFNNKSITYDDIRVKIWN